MGPRRPEARDGRFRVARGLVQSGVEDLAGLGRLRVFRGAVVGALSRVDLGPPWARPV